MINVQHQNARAQRTRVGGQEQGLRGPPAKSCAVLNLLHRAKTPLGCCLVGWWAGGLMAWWAVELVE